MIVKVGGNRNRRNWRKQWLSRATKRDFLNPRYVKWRPSRDEWRWRSVDSHNHRSITRAQNQTHEVRLPTRLDFEDNYDVTASHFRLVRDGASGNFRIRKLRFDDIEYISPAAALVLASEVDIWNQRSSGRLTADVSLWKDQIKRLLCQMGYFELLGLKRPAIQAQPNGVTFLEFLTGESGVGNPGERAKKLRENIETIVGQGISRRPLYDGLSEAITNVSQHAYPRALPNNRKKQWWLSASFDKSCNGLTVIFFDHGVGIPQTLPRSYLWETIKDVFHKWTDSQKIAAAMEPGRSSTELPERGKGLRNLVEFAKAHDEGRLSIYSQKGLYQLVHKSNGIRTSRRDSEKTIGGTLIEWSVRL